MYTVVCRRIFEAEGGVERELAKRENEMGSPVDKTVWARDEMSFRENIKTLCIFESAHKLVSWRPTLALISPSLPLMKSALEA